MTFTADALPFDLRLNHFIANCQPQQAGRTALLSVPVVDGFSLRAMAVAKEEERNVPGIYAAVIDKQTGRRQEGVLWGLKMGVSAADADAPWTVTASDGELWGIDLRHKRYRLPYIVNTFTVCPITTRSHG